MITLEDLNQLYYLEREILLQQQRLQELNKDPNDEIFDIINDLLQHCVAEKERLENYIANINNDYIQQMFLLRFVAGLSWKDVAANVGANRGSVKMICQRYIKAHQ